MLALNRTQLRSVTGFQRQHDPFKNHQHTMKLYDGDMDCDFADRTQRQHNTFYVTVRHWIAKDTVYMGR